MTYNFGTPLRSLTNAIEPVLGFHAGEVLAPFANVRRFRSLPLEFTEYNSGFPFIEEENTILEPFCDQDGAPLVPLKSGKLTTLPASMEYKQICGLAGPVPLLE